MARTSWRADARAAARGHFGGFFKKSIFDGSNVENMSRLNQKLSFIKPLDFEKHALRASYFDLMHFGAIFRFFKKFEFS